MYYNDIIKEREAQFVIEYAEIVFLETSGNKVNVYTKNETFECRLKLYELNDMLDSFAQINKSTLVNIDYVKSIQAEFSGNYLLKLKNRKELLTVSRKYFKDFKNKI